MGILATPCHTTLGRIRLRLMQPLPQSKLESVSKQLLELPGTEAVRFSTVTGSLVLHHSLSSNAAYMLNVTNQGLVDIVNGDGSSELTQSSPNYNDFLMSLDQLDQRIRDITGGECNLRVAGAVAFTTMGLLQIGRGMGLPAGLTLLVNAARIMRIPSEKRHQKNRVHELC